MSSALPDSQVPHDLRRFEGAARLADGIVTFAGSGD
jgi:hypothetical protein